ncbi:hypothetical protein FXN61_07900 [Lentzea sp. PSKA42]|uniref:NfeD-like C-terminal domain-containing protein n=1 Tax=Lentzea indica TaxID=2604800 RepID=A0ABX1FCV6_9PSEU|nr:hypothetical protein [Lentzea indica]NKE56759.1 hypothetical protein [Lentzea indica]
MTVHTLVAKAGAGALRVMQNGPGAYHCPAGHGALRVWPDENAPSELSLVCTRCGHRIMVDAALIELAERDAATVEVTEPEPMVRLPGGAAPRGLGPDGTVRTTGWVQLGKLRVSSGFCAAQAAFLATAPLIQVIPWISVVATPLGYLAWKLCSTTWFPASQAVNVRRVRVEELTAGQQIRLYGAAGPVGEVSAVAADAAGRIRLRMVGGRELLRRSGQLVWQVDLRN